MFWFLLFLGWFTVVQAYSPLYPLDDACSAKVQSHLVRYHHEIYAEHCNEKEPSMECELMSHIRRIRSLSEAYATIITRMKCTDEFGHQKNTTDFQMGLDAMEQTYEVEFPDTHQRLVESLKDSILRRKMDELLKQLKDGIQCAKEFKEEFNQLKKEEQEGIEGLKRELQRVRTIAANLVSPQSILDYVFPVDPNRDHNNPSSTSTSKPSSDPGSRIRDPGEPIGGWGVMQQVELKKSTPR